MITEDYVSFETAKLLKEKGVDELCPTFYETDKPDNGPKYSKKLGWFLHNSYDYSDRHGKMIISAPTLQMAMKWLREEKGIAVIPVISSILDNEKFLWDVKIVFANFHWSVSVVIIPESCCNHVGRRDLHMSVDWSTNIEKIETCAEEFYNLIRKIDIL